MPVDAETWLQAENETEFSRSQIQGFFYPRPEDTDLLARSEHLPGRLVLRDLSQPKESQILWELSVEAGGYTEGVRQMEKQMRLAGIERVVECYERITVGGCA